MSTRKSAPAKKAPAAKKAAAPSKDPSGAPQAAGADESEEAGADPAPAPRSPAEKQAALDIATRAARLAKDEKGEIDVKAELIGINRKLEYLAAQSNITLPS